jgi:hypothetical protein
MHLAVLTNYVTELLYILLLFSSAENTTSPWLIVYSTVTLSEKWKGAKSARKRDKHANYCNKLIYEVTGNGRNYEKGKSDVTVGIRRRERGLGQKNDETTVTNDSSSIVIDRQGRNDAQPTENHTVRTKRGIDGRLEDEIKMF